jgi:hypothetical protein
MTLPCVSADAVKAGDTLSRADTKSELEVAWVSAGCASFTGANHRYLTSIYDGQVARFERHAQALQWARAS